MKIPEKHISRLRSYDLFVAEPTSPEHCYPDGVLVGKPKTTAGNSIPNYSSGFMIDVESNNEIEFDAPPVWFFGHCGVWVVQAQQYSPVPGPGDFIDEWETAEQAVDDILDFYFGDPKRMEAKAEAKKKPHFKSDGDTNSTARASA